MRLTYCMAEQVKTSSIDRAATVSGEVPIRQKTKRGTVRLANWAAKFAVGKVALPNVCCWENSGKHMIA
jgi:hypothetical protein